MKAAGVSAAVVILAMAICASMYGQTQQPLNFFQYNQGSTVGTIVDADNAGDSNLFVVPVPIQFQYMIYHVSVVDTSGNPYDMGVGDCPYTTPAHDCSQAEAQIVLVCNTASPGQPGALVVNVIDTHKVPCVQGVVMLQPGIYMHLSAAGATSKAKCLGTGTPLSPFQGSPIQTYSVQNGSLAQSVYPLMTAKNQGAHSSVNGCAVGLSMR